MTENCLLLLKKVEFPCVFDILLVKGDETMSYPAFCCTDFASFLKCFCSASDFLKTA